jgi:HK97 gp10 family phage protein
MPRPIGQSLPKGGKRRLLTGRDARSGSALYYVELQGQQELRAALDRFDVEAIRASKEAVASSAREIEREAKMRAPVRALVPDYKISAAKAAQSPGFNVRDRIKTILRDAGLTATIGTGYFVARFVEFGTRKMSARPFLGPAFEVMRPKYLSRLHDALNRVIKRAA